MVSQHQSEVKSPAGQASKWSRLGGAWCFRAGMGQQNGTTMCGKCHRSQLGKIIKMVVTPLPTTVRANRLAITQPFTQFRRVAARHKYACEVRGARCGVEGGGGRRVRACPPGVDFLGRAGGLGGSRRCQHHLTKTNQLWYGDRLHTKAANRLPGCKRGCELRVATPPSPAAANPFC